MVMKVSEAARLLAEHHKAQAAHAQAIAARAKVMENTAALAAQTQDPTNIPSPEQVGPQGNMNPVGAPQGAGQLSPQLAMLLGQGAPGGPAPQIDPQIIMAALAQQGGQ